MNSNRSLQEIIDSLPKAKRNVVFNAPNVKTLLKLKPQYKNNPDMIQVIEARIQNLTPLSHF